MTSLHRTQKEGKSLGHAGTLAEHAGTNKDVFPCTSPATLSGCKSGTRGPRDSMHGVPRADVSARRRHVGRLCVFTESNSHGCLRFCRDNHPITPARVSPRDAETQASNRRPRRRSDASRFSTALFVNRGAGCVCNRPGNRGKETRFGTCALRANQGDESRFVPGRFRVVGF